MGQQDHLFAGVGGFASRPDAVGAVGVFRRPGGQAAWEHVLADHETYALLVHPDDPAIVLAGTRDGIWRSTDHGQSFRRTSGANSQVWSLLADRRDGKRIWAGTSPIGLLLSEDMGVTWTALPEPGLPEHCKGPFSNRVMRLAQYPERPDSLVAALEINGVMLSDDGGKSWRDGSRDLIRQAAAPHLASAIVTDDPSEGMLDNHAVAIAPGGPETAVLAGRMGLFRSADAGATWQDMEVGRFSPTTYGRDIKASEHDPDCFYAALSVAALSEDGGVYRSRDGGATWDRFDKVQVHGTIMSVCEHPRDPDRVFLGAQNGGEIFGTADSGESWTEMSLPGPVQIIYTLAAG